MYLLILTQFQRYKYFFKDSENFFLHKLFKSTNFSPDQGIISREQKPQSINLRRKSDSSEGLSI